MKNTIVITCIVILAIFTNYASYRKGWEKGMLEGYEKGIRRQQDLDTLIQVTPLIDPFSTLKWQQKGSDGVWRDVEIKPFNAKEFKALPSTYDTASNWFELMNNKVTTVRVIPKYKIEKVK